MRVVRLAMLLTAAAGAVSFLNAQNAQPLYRQQTASVDARVADLLGRMTIEEKAAQLQGVWNRKREIQNARGEFDPSKAQALLGQGIGEVARPSEIAGAPADLNGRTAREEALIRADAGFPDDPAPLGEVSLQDRAELLG